MSQQERRELWLLIAIRRVMAGELERAQTAMDAARMLAPRVRRVCRSGALHDWDDDCDCSMGRRL